MLSLIEDKLMELGIDQIMTVSASDSMDNKAKWNYLKENLYFGGWKQFKSQLDRQKDIGKSLEQTILRSKLKILKYNRIINQYRQI